MIITQSTYAEVQLNPIKVSDRVYYFQGYSQLGSSTNENFISNAGFIITPAGVVVVDALGSPALAEKMVQKIHEITPKPIIKVILTHYHADHIYGLQVFKDLGVSIVAHKLGQSYLTSENALQRLKVSQKELAPAVNEKTRIVAADEWLEEDKTFDYGGLELKVIHMGPAHTAEDIAIYLPSEQLIFVGDIVFRGRVPYIGNGNSLTWLKSLEKLEKLKAKVIIPGHGEYSKNAEEDIKFTKNYINFLRANLYKPAKDLEPFDETYQKIDWSSFEKIPLFHAANRLNAYNVYLSIQTDE